MRTSAISDLLLLEDEELVEPPAHDAIDALDDMDLLDDAEMPDIPYDLDLPNEGEMPDSLYDVDEEAVDEEEERLNELCNAFDALYIPDDDREEGEAPDLK
jgi:hypothetical protein